MPERVAAKLVASSIVLNERRRGSGQLVQTRAVDGIRVVSRDGALVYYVQVFGAREDGGEQMRVRILRDGAEVDMPDWAPLKSRMVERLAEGIAVGGELDLAAFSPGTYELRVTIRDARGKREIERSTPFRVQ